WSSKRKVPPWWKTSRVGDLFVGTDPRAGIAISNDSLAIIGNAVDINTGEFQLHILAEKLFGAVQRSLEDFQAAVNDLCGRFVVLYERDGIVRLQQDPIGMRSV